MDLGHSVEKAKQEVGQDKDLMEVSEWAMQDILYCRECSRKREQNVQICWCENVQNCKHREIGLRSKCGADKGRQCKPLQRLLHQIVYFVNYFIQVGPLHSCLYIYLFVCLYHPLSLLELENVVLKYTYVMFF